MNTSPLPSKSKLSSFDDMVEWVDGAQLLFRLHSNKFCRTFFHPKENVLVSSLHRQNLSEDSTSEDLSLRLTALEKAPSSLTDEDSEAVERHITSWINNDKEKSNFISLTLNVLHALWLWKRRIPSLTQSEGREDDFRIIVLNSSKLRAQAKLGTELLSNEPEKHKEARRFALQHEEVIVAKHIKSEAILGSMPMSRLEAFIPSWCRKLLETPKSIPGSKKLTFVESLPPRVDKVDCAMVRESLRFSLALLAPMLVPDEKLQANIGSGKEAGRGAIEHSRTEGDSRVKPACGPEMVLVSGHSVTEEGYVFIQSLHKKPITYHVHFKWEPDSCITQPEEAGPLPGGGKPAGRDSWGKSTARTTGQAEKTVRGGTTPA